MTNLEKLIETCCGPALCESKFPQTQSIVDQSHWSELLSLLSKRNGFYAYESALLVLPAESCEGTLNVVEWNRFETWKSSYLYHDLTKVICFGLNIFGDQFCFDSEGFGRLDAETAEIERLGDNLEEWAETIMAEPDYYLGWSIGREWQKRNGPLGSNMRLVPKIPFILGGKFEVDNLYCLDAMKSMQMRGEICTQLHEHPDGSTITIK